jgi:antitoxin component YwqK of YwqJK toxin-antitoxin module
MRRFLPLIIFIVSFNDLYSQNSETADFEAEPTSINDVIKQVGYDTVIFYYNESWHMVKPVCATAFRITRVDTIQFNFTGKFVDYYAHDSTIAVEGSYSNGKKEGRFNIYYPNGQLEQAGNYAHDRKSGIWEYFYDDGTKRQVLDFQGDEVLIQEFWNEEGKQLVASGNGEWFTYGSSDKFMKTSGEVLNGRKNGTWKNTLPSRNITVNTEKYKDGKFLSGKISSVAFGSQTYKDTLYCTIEKPHAFLTAEQFQVSRCFKLQKNKWEFATYPGGMDRFYQQIREKLELNGPVVRRGILKVTLTISTDGKMMNFKPVTDLGHEHELIQVLQTMDNWTPTKLNGKPTIQPKVISFEIR